MATFGRVTLGIVGGCLSHQTDIRLSRLYHRRLVEAVRGEAGLHLRVKIARAFELDHTQRLVKLAVTERLDAVLLHVRTEFLQRARIVFARQEDDRVIYYLHPRLFRREMRSWYRILEEGARGCPRVWSRRSGSPGGSEEPAWQTPAEAGAVRGGRFLRDLATLVGHGGGLGTWAVRNELEEVQRFIHACRERDLPLVVLGPTPASAGLGSASLLRRMNAALRTLLEPERIPFATFASMDIEANRPLLMPDEFHLNEAGHARVAELIAPHVISVLTDGKNVKNGGSLTSTQ